METHDLNIDITSSASDRFADPDSQSILDRRAFVQIATLGSATFLLNPETSRATSDSATAQTTSGSSRTVSKGTGMLLTQKLRRTDLTVSRIAYGTNFDGLDSKASDFVEKAAQVLHGVYDEGINLIDLADGYNDGKSESALGVMLRQSPNLRRNIVIQTKCGILPPAASAPDEDWILDLSADHIVRAAEGSLQRLGTDHIDILLLHMPDPLMDPNEVAQALDRLKHAGKVRYFGVSNFNAVQIELLQRYLNQPLVVNQIQMGLQHYSAMITDVNNRVVGFGAIVDYCNLHDIQVEAYSPLMGEVDPRRNLLRPPADAPPEVKKAAQVLVDMAKEKNVSPSAIALAWLLRHPAHIIPVVGSINAEHIKQNCAAVDVTLTREEWTRLLAASVSIQSSQGT